MRKGFSAAVLVAFVLSAAGSRAEAPFFPSVELRCRAGAGTTSCSQNTEPDVKVAPDGTAYVSAILGVPGGTNFWRRAAGDTVYRHRGTPEWMDRVGNRGLALGGGDTALAIAPEPNASGVHNVYVASLYAAGVTVATSRDRGETWELNVLTAPITADRQWLVADGAETIYLAYVDFSRGGLAVVARSDDGGRVFGPPIPVYGPEDQARGLSFRARWGSLVIDRATGALYWPHANVSSAEEGVAGQVPGAGVTRHVLRMAVSRDGGLTWRNPLVHTNPPDRRMDAVFPWATTDAAGNVYAMWSDTKAAYMTASSDGAETWAEPVRVSSSPVRGVVLPTMIGGRAGTVDLAFVGTESDDIDDPSSVWHVYFVQTLDALSAAPAFTQVVASDEPVHVGSVCLRGLGCELPEPAGRPGDRSLAEILTIELDADGMAVLASPYDFRAGRQRGSTQSLLMKQRGLARAFDSDLPVTGLDPEPK